MVLQLPLLTVVLLLLLFRVSIQILLRCDRYANRAKNIKNKPKINEDPKDALLREFQEEIARLKAALEAKGGGGGSGGRKRRGRRQPRTGPDGWSTLLLNAFVIFYSFAVGQELEV